mgnify:CR=1 FL=1
MILKRKLASYQAGSEISILITFKGCENHDYLVVHRLILCYENKDQ